MADLFDGNPAEESSTKQDQSSKKESDEKSSKESSRKKEESDKDEVEEKTQSATDGSELSEEEGSFGLPGITPLKFKGGSKSGGLKSIVSTAFKLGGGTTAGLTGGAMLIPIVLLSFLGIGAGVSTAVPIAGGAHTVMMADDDCAVNDKKSSSSGGGVDGTLANSTWTEKGTQQYETAKRIFERLTKDLGMSGAGAAGILGNFAQETGFNPNTTNASDGGYGIAQWTHVRKDKLMAWCNKNNKDPKDLDTQIDFLITELRDKSMWYGVHWPDNSLQVVGMLSDPKEAAARFYLSHLEAGGGNNSDPDGTQPKREAYAQKAYELFDGASIKGDESLLGAAGEAASSGSSDAKDKDNKCDDNDVDSSSLIKAAKSMLGWFKYDQIHTEAAVGSFDDPDKDGRTDCSGFVWLALYKAGYKVPEGMGWYTKSMEDDAKGDHKWLKEISESEAKAGDIVIVNTGNGAGSNGHTAILLDSWKADEPETTNSTKVIQMGGAAHDGVNIHKFGESFLSLVNGTYGAHTITFARPIKK